MSQLFKYLIDRQYIFIMAGCRCVQESCIQRTKTNSDELKDDEIFGWVGDARGTNKYMIKTKKKKKKNNPSKRKRKRTIHPKEREIYTNFISNKFVS